jgi:hypothetical protein
MEQNRDLMNKKRVGGGCARTSGLDGTTSATVKDRIRRYGEASFWGSVLLKDDCETVLF